MRDIEDELKAEIDFWRSMLNKMIIDSTNREYKRIRDALDLAEFKLERLELQRAASGYRIH